MDNDNESTSTSSISIAGSFHPNREVVEERRDPEATILVKKEGTTLEMQTSNWRLADIPRLT
jgi:hypothetical protein